MAIDPYPTRENFAYPYGFALLDTKRSLKELYRSSRGIRTALNEHHVDRLLLRGNPLIDVHKNIDGICRLMGRGARAQALVDLPRP